ncbi:MAG: IS4 family transposase [Patescibacteria group bacterium]
MNFGKTVFAQLIQHLPWYEFNQCVLRYHGNHKVRSFSCMDQFLCMAFAQLTYRESLRDIVTCLNSHRPKLYHMGFRGNIAKSTLADANELRDFRIYQDFGYILIDIASKLYRNEELGLDLKLAVYALDSTVIDLCLSTFPWATFRKKKAAVKIHTLLNVQGSIPTFIFVTPGSVHDVNMMDSVPFEADSVYTMDRAYLDFERLYHINQLSAFFVIRSKRNTRLRRIHSASVEKSIGVQADQTVLLVGYKSRMAYPDPLRRVRYHDAERDKRLVFLTNNFLLPAKTVADIYRSRWQVELFFKWIKQHLRIKTFFGTSPNAVKTQIWTAVSVYLLVAIVKKRLNLSGSLHTILQILEVNLFEKIPISQLVNETINHENEHDDDNQLNLFT